MAHDVLSKAALLARMDNDPGLLGEVAGAWFSARAEDCFDAAVYFFCQRSHQASTVLYHNRLFCGLPTQ
jgi:hypothetical protein